MGLKKDRRRKATSNEKKGTRNWRRKQYQEWHQKQNLIGMAQVYFHGDVDSAIWNNVFNEITAIARQRASDQGIDQEEAYKQVEKALRDTLEPVA